MFKDIKVGQTVFVKRVEHYHGAKETIVEEIVSSVGKLYFYTGEGYMKSKYHKDSGRLFSQYSTNTMAYLSMQEINDEKERAELMSFMNNQFSWRGKPVSLDQLRRIKAIIDETNQQ